jgi:hypothetical protein
VVDGIGAAVRPPTGRHAVDVLDLDAVAATLATARDDPAEVVDPDVLPADVLDEGTDLARRHEEEPISVYVASIRAGA